MTDRPQIFDLDFMEIFNKAVDDFQSTTGYALERHDAEKIMIQIFASMVFGWGSQWLEASIQNYLDYMTGPQLDAYGESNDEPRLASTPSGAWMRFHFTEALVDLYPIYKNTIVTGRNDNGTFTFKVLEDVLADPNAGSGSFSPGGSGSPDVTYVDIWVEEFIDETTNSGDLANDIPIGDIDTLEDDAGIYSLVDSVENIGESYGGHASENDDHYRARLKYILGKPSTAGAFDAYVFHALSASVKVLDVGIKKPGWEIEIYTLSYDLSTKVIGDASSQITNVALDGLNVADTDNGRLYWDLTGSPTRTLSLYADSAKTVKVAEYVGVNGTGVTIAAEPGHTVNGTCDLTGSTNDNDIANVFETYAISMGAIDQMMNPSAGYSKVKPINDIVSVHMCEAVNFTISKCNVQIFEGNVETVKAKVTQVVKNFRDSLRTKAGKDAVLGDLDTLIRKIGGIYNTDLEFNSDFSIDVVEAEENEFLTCSLPTINVTVKE